MSVNGTISTLRAGDYESSVATVGASLLRLTHRGRDLVLPRGEDRVATHYEGVTLVPWANRITGGRYAVRGRELRVPVNEPGTGAALHGLGAFQHWVPSEVGPDRGSWSLDLPPTPGYPFDLTCRVDYVLDAEDGLGVTITGTNDGAEPAPFAASTHPYLTCGGPVDGCTVRLPAGRYLQVDDRSVPTALAAASGEHDLRAPVRLGARRLDHAYTDLPEGEWGLRLEHPDGGVELRSTARWVQVYTGDDLGRAALAVEPMTHEPDAFNRDPDGVLLEPGESRRLELTIRALRG